MSIAKVEVSNKVNLLDKDPNLETAQECIIKLFVKKKYARAEEYRDSVIQTYKSNKKYDSMFKIEMTYLEQLAQSIHSSKTPDLFLSFLGDITELQKKELENNEYKENFCRLVLDSTLTLAKHLSTNGYQNAIRLYNQANVFFISYHSLYSNLLIMKKGDLLKINAQHEAAYTTYKSVFHNTHYLIPMVDSFSKETVLKQLSDALQHLCGNKQDGNEKIYHKFIALIAEKNLTQLNEIKQIILNNLTKKDYSLYQALLYLCKVLIFCLNLSDSSEQHSLAESNKASLSDLIKLLHENISYFKAIHENDIQKVTDLLNAGVSLNVRNINKQTPLQFAIKLNNVAITRLLIEEGKVSVEDNESTSPIFLAIDSKNKDLVALLLDAGVDVNTSNYRLGSPLYYALTTDQEDIISILVERGAFLTSKERQKLTPRADQIYKKLFEQSFLSIKRHLTSNNTSLIYPIGGDPHSMRTPIICLHAIDGGGPAFQPFAKEMAKKDKRLIYHISHPALIESKSDNNSINFSLTIEQMAELYVMEIKQREPIGPYILFGWSFGGLLAFEMAKKFHELNDKISMVVLFDTIAPSTMHAMSNEKYAEHLLGVMERLAMMYWSKEEHAKNHNPTFNDLCKLSKEDQISAILPPLEKIKDKDTQKFIKVIKSNLVAALNYNPTIDFNNMPLITCFNAEITTQKYGPYLGWVDSNDNKQPISHPKLPFYISENLIANIIPNEDHFFIIKDQTTHEKKTIVDLVSSIISHKSLKMADALRRTYFHLNKHYTLEQFLELYKKDLELLNRMTSLDLASDQQPNHLALSRLSTTKGVGFFDNKSENTMTFEMETSSSNKSLS